LAKNQYIFCVIDRFVALFGVGEIFTSANIVISVFFFCFVAGKNLFSARCPTNKDVLVQSAPRMAKRSASAPLAPAEASIRKIFAGFSMVTGN
jgi:hypothetical protein